jgi:hypothetical protein
MSDKTKDALAHLALAWDLLAPKADEGCAWRMVAESKADGTQDPKDHCRIVTSGIYDGLAYGNWPSAVAKLGKYEAQP